MHTSLFEEKTSTVQRSPTDSAVTSPAQLHRHSRCVMPYVDVIIFCKARALTLVDIQSTCPSPQLQLSAILIMTSRGEQRGSSECLAAFSH